MKFDRNKTWKVYLFRRLSLHILIGFVQLVVANTDLWNNVEGTGWQTKQGRLLCIVCCGQFVIKIDGADHSFYLKG